MAVRIRVSPRPPDWWLERATDETVAASTDRDTGLAFVVRQCERGG
jgi:hypothetical protein